LTTAAEVAKLPPEEQKAEVKKRRGGGRKKKVQPVEEDEPEETPTPLTDGIGLPVPEELREVFAARELFKKAKSLHKQLTQVINEIALIDSVASQRMRTQLSARAKGEEAYYRHVKLEDVLSFLKTWEPYVAMCPPATGTTTANLTRSARVVSVLAGCPGAPGSKPVQK
jgi:hypothetical protein